jgi:DNA-binding transcriptional LysR family regulator
MTAALDWDDLRFLLALVRKRKLSAASEELGVTQSTVGRRLARLESCLGVRLMDRTPNGYIATSVARPILEEVERLELGALSIIRIAARGDHRLQGTVRIACVEPIANHILVPQLPALHAEHPDITIALNDHTRNLSLPMRQADIGLRFVRPSQKEVIVRKIGKVDFGLYASPVYLDRSRSLSGAAQTLILPDDDAELAMQHQWLLTTAGTNRIVLKTNSYAAQISCAFNGGGIACLPCFHAEGHSGLQRISTANEPPAADLYLTVHRDNKETARFRMVIEWIVEAVRKALIPICAASPATAIDPAHQDNEAAPSPGLAVKRSGSAASLNGSTVSSPILHSEAG